MYAAIGGPNMKWGAHISNGDWAPLVPRWRRPCSQVKEKFSSGEIQ